MARNLLNEITLLNSQQLSTLLETNGKGEIKDVISNREIDGKRFLALTELELLNWKLPLRQRKLIWSFLTDLKQNPQSFKIENALPEEQKLPRRSSFLVNNEKADIRQQLELKLAVKPQLTRPTSPLNIHKINKPKLELPSATDINEEIQKQIDSLGFYDERGYLTPIIRQKFEHQIVYEDCDNNDLKTATGSIKNKVREPLPLPRVENYSDDDDAAYYINNLDNEENEEVYEEPPTTPTVQVQKRDAIDNSIKKNRKVNFNNVASENEFARSRSKSVAQMPSQSPETGKSWLEFLPRFLSFRKNKEETKTWRRSMSLRQADTAKIDNPPTVKHAKQPKIPITCRPLPPTPTKEQNLYERRSLPPTPQDSDNSELFESDDNELFYENKETVKSLSNLLLDDTRNDEVDQVYENNEEASKAYKDLNENMAVPQATFLNNYEHFRISSDVGSHLKSPKHILRTREMSEESEEYDSVFYNLNDEPFYRNTDRKGARLLLQGLEDGAFLVRPSKKYFLTLSVKYKLKFFNLGLEKTENNNIRITSDDGNPSPEFRSISEMIDYFTEEPLTLQHEDQVVALNLKKVLF